MENEAKLRVRPNRKDARSDELEVRIPDRLKGMMPSGQDVNLQPIQTKLKQGSRPFNGAGQAPMPLGRPEGPQTPETQAPEDRYGDARMPGDRALVVWKTEQLDVRLRSMGFLGRPTNGRGDPGIRKYAADQRLNAPDQTVHEEQDSNRPNRKSPNKVQRVERDGSGFSDTEIIDSLASNQEEQDDEQEKTTPEADGEV